MEKRAGHRQGNSVPWSLRSVGKWDQRVEDGLEKWVKSRWKGATADFGGSSPISVLPFLEAQVFRLAHDHGEQELDFSFRLAGRYGHEVLVSGIKSSVLCSNSENGLKERERSFPPSLCPASCWDSGVQHGAKPGLMSEKP